MRWVLILLALMGCGRVHFDPRGDAASDAALSAVAQRAYLKASNPGAYDGFGGPVALSGDGTTLAVGAWFEDSAATGIDGDQTSQGAVDAGAVYVFTRTGTGWTQQAYLKASNAGFGDYFGYAISLSADGSTLAVGAWRERSNATGVDGNQADNSLVGAGAVYVFTRAAATWTQQAYLKASNTGTLDYFGVDVALSSDGSTLAVAADGEYSAATGIGGNEADDSASSAGAVYVFTRLGAAWTQQVYIKASNTETLDEFGFSIALSGDGSTLAVASLQEASAATGIDGNQADNSAPGAGAVYLFTRLGITWTQAAYIKASNTDADDAFGGGISLSADASTLAVRSAEDSAATGIDGDQADNSAVDAGAVYVFARAGASWAQQAYIKASNTDAGDSFGASALSSDGSTLAVSALGEDSAATGNDGDQADNSMADSGAVYLLERTGTAWIQRAYIKASNTDALDLFGSVELSDDGSTLVVGAMREDSGATGIGGDQTDNSVSDAGAVYVFE